MAKSKSITDDDQEYIDLDESTTDQEDSNSDDSDSDPNYDILEDTCKSLSKLSLKKSKSKVKDCDRKRKLDFDDVVKMPEFDEKDAKSFETVEEIIKAGQLGKLKVDQCKVYLRKYGLRLTGTKDVLLGRIREHLEIMNGGGEQKYPASSFVLNCKGDACTGDVVMFEQNVYEMYNIASRSATGPPCGTRIVAGCIVKESYGAAKQQHTFTIEVLWSKGEKPLPPLHPLLIKGRNLYRLKTVRQKWTDEAERSKVLLEKHSRGSLARSTRETRMQGKENRKMHKEQRARNSTTTIHKENQHPNYMQQQNVPNQSLKRPVESAVQSNRVLHQEPQHPLSNQVQPNYSQKQNVPIQRSQKPIDSAFQPNGLQQQNVPMQRLQRPIESSLQPNNNLTGHIQPKPQQIQIQFQQNNSMPQQTFRSENPNQIQNSNASRNWWGNVAASDKQNFRAQSPLRNPMQQKPCNYFARGSCKFGDTCKYLHESGKGQSSNAAPWSPLYRFHGSNGFVNRQALTGMCSPPRHVHAPNGFVNRQALTGIFSPPRNAMRQPCPFFPQGRCHYGDRCKYLHVQRR